MTEQQINQIVEMYQDERSYTKIAKDTGLSVYQVKRWVRLNRDNYELKRRRSMSDKTGALSLAAELETTWNIKASRRYLAMPWGAAHEAQ